MAAAIIRCNWKRGEVGNEHLAHQCVEFARRLQSVHPLLSEIGLTGGKDGVENMLKAPTVSSVSVQDWNEMFDDKRREHGYITMLFWNRRPVKQEYFGYALHANDSYVDNSIVTRELPEPLNSAEYINNILAAAIDSFRVSEAAVFTLWHSDPTGWITRHWRLWLKAGEAWPEGPRKVDDAVGPYRDAETWLGGTLYTWPEYEPWRYEGPG